MNLLLDLIRHIANLPLSSPLSIQVVDEFRRFFYRNILYCMCHGKNMLHFAATNFIRFRFKVHLPENTIDFFSSEHELLLALVGEAVHHVRHLGDDVHLRKA